MRYSILFVLFLSLTSCFTSERNCKDFKTGEFYSEIITKDSIYKSVFTRTKNLQVERFRGKIDSAEVRWINDCELVTKTINPKNRAERKDIHFKILQTTDSSYTYEYSYVGETQKQKGIVYKVK
ncbi:DNA topoisomerase IV [Lacinutrix salivirga]